MPVKYGLIQQSHPYAEIVVSADAKNVEKFTALLDTGYSGFVSLPTLAASRLGLEIRNYMKYVLADGSESIIPVGDGFASLEGDPLVHGIVAFSQHNYPTVGVDFLLRCGKAMMLFSHSVLFIDQDELMEDLKSIAALKAEEERQRNKRPDA